MNHIPINTIFDTDLLSDCDDAGALAVLHRLADLGEAEILACIINAIATDKAIAASLSAINTYYGRAGIPIGTYQGTRIRPDKSKYNANLRDEFPQYALSDDKMPCALEVYRTALAEAPDGSVAIISVGFLVNLRELLESNPDSASPLPGLELVRRKVKRLVVMGGHFSPCSDRPEFNMGANGSEAAPDAQYVIQTWPTEILFSGFEVGAGISTGPTLIPTPAENPVRRAYELYGTLETGRPSWDLTTVLAAVRNPLLYWDVEQDGYCQVSPTGVTHWISKPGRGHSYLTPKLTNEEMERILGELLAATPAL